MARKMKDSGSPWLGQIPADWKVSRVGLHFSIILGKMLCNSQPNDSYTLEPYYCAADVHFDGVANGERKKMWFNTAEKELYRVVVGDLLVVEGGAGAGGSAIVTQQDSDTYVQNSIMIVRNKGASDNRYLRYLLEAFVKRGYIDIVCNKATIPHFTKDKLSCVPLCICPGNEQKRISDYLDVQCSRIDAMLTKNRASIEEYKKLKQAVITQAVTKGVRGKREMKDSGIEWIGEIPKEWSAKRGKQLFIETNERSETGSEELLTVSHLTGVTPRSQKNVNMFMSESLVGYKVCRKGDLAANTMWMWQGAIGVSKFYGVISPSYNTYRQRNDNFHPEYLDYLLRIRPLIDTYNIYSTGITLSRLRLYPQSFLSIYFIVPPMVEQQEIADYLDAKCTEIDRLIAKKEQLVKELEWYKKSLIYEVVTGKREV